MLKQATKSFTPGTAAQYSGVKARPEVSKVPNKQRLTERSATESKFFLKRGARNSGNRGGMQQQGMT
jgi:hypothetical protein